MKACGQTRLWSLHRTPKQHFFSCSQEQPQRISILWSVFPNCTDTLFSITIVLSVLYLSVLRGLLPSCACTVVSIRKGFIPDTGDCSQLLFWTGIWAQSRPAARHLKQFVPPSLLRDSTFGVHFWSDVFPNLWRGVEGDPLLPRELQCPGEPLVP